MRRRYLLHSLAFGLLPACSAPSPYDATAVALARAERPTAFYGLAKDWKPLGKGYSYEISEEESVREQFFLHSCISELTARFDPAPGPALRAVQLSECMQARGWHLALEELIPPGAASPSRR
jgi:hypothetical protein